MKKIKQKYNWPSENDMNETLAIDERVRAAKQNIDDRIAGFENLKTRKSRVFQWMKVAALIFVIASASFYFYQSGVSKKLKIVTYTIIKSPVNQRKKIILIDGTTVWLNAKSELSFNNLYNEKTREITMVGEAFFEVTKNKKIPFIVNSAGIQIKVLGTSFNIAAYPEDENVTIALLTGKIWLKAPDGNNEVLMPNQTISFNKKKNHLEPIITESAENYTAWKDGKIVFNNISLAAAAVKLERIFNVSIDIKEDELSQTKINGNFTVHQRPTEVLEVLCRLVGARYRIDHQQISISSVK
nr:FecR domain-containing protein [Pseudopedobacter sp.]